MLTDEPDRPTFTAGEKLRVTMSMVVLPDGSLKVGKQVGDEWTEEVFPPDHPKSIQFRAIAFPGGWQPDARPAPGALHRIAKIDYDTRTVTYEAVPDAD